MSEIGQRKTKIEVKEAMISIAAEILQPCDNVSGIGDNLQYDSDTRLLQICKKATESSQS